MPNRIEAAIEAKRVELAKRIADGLTTKEKVEDCRKALDIDDLFEYARFQELKTLAMANGLLTPEEAQTVYVYLGNIPTTFNNQDVAVKAVLTGLYQELLQAEIKRRYAAGERPRGKTLRRSKR